MNFSFGSRRKIRVAYASMSPFVEVQTVYGRDILGGFMPQMLKLISEWMNLELLFIREPFDMYGTAVNNNFTGMVGMLYRNEVDLILNPILPREEYFEFSHFTNAITIEAYTILSGKRTQDGGLFLYLSVLDGKVWFGLFITLLIMSITTGILLKTGSTHFRGLSKAIGHCSWNLISSMFKQVTNEKWLMRKSTKPSSFFMSLLVLLWSVFVSFMVMNVCQSLLVSKLTLQKFEPVVSTMGDVAEGTSFLCLVPREIMFQNVLEDSNAPINQKALKKINFEYSQETVFGFENMAKIEDGKYCVIHGQLIVSNILSKYFKKKGRCNLHVSEEKFFPFSLVMVIHRKFPPEFFNTFNLGITRLVDADISGRWFRQAIAESNLCTSYRENHLKPLGIENIKGVLLIWGCGLLLSLVSLLVETILFRMKKP